MYALVSDIEAYPTFLPWCHSVTVHHNDVETVRATIEVKRGPVQYSFTTFNQCIPNVNMHMQLVEGPFKNLEGEWRFEQLGEDACKISFHIEFEFKSRVLRMSLGPVFSKTMDSLMDAFVARAQHVYGR